MQIVVVSFPWVVLFLLLTKDTENATVASDGFCLIAIFAFNVAAFVPESESERGLISISFVLIRFRLLKV